MCDGKAWSNPKHGGGSVCGHFINWHTIPIYGFVYDVTTGRLNEVGEASAAGRPTA